MTSISDEISSPAIASRSSGSLLGGGAQLLEAGRQFERAGVEDRELLLDADGEVGGVGERLGGSV